MRVFVNNSQPMSPRTEYRDFADPPTVDAMLSNASPFFELADAHRTEVERSGIAQWERLIQVLRHIEGHIECMRSYVEFVLNDHQIAEGSEVFSVSKKRLLHVSHQIDDAQRCIDECAALEIFQSQVDIAREMRDLLTTLVRE